MAQVPATSYESTSLGDVAEFTIPFPFLSRAEVFVTVDGAPVAFTWINDGLVQLAEVPELGAVVRRYRSTVAYVPLHQFSQGVPFLPRYVDRDFKQTLYAVQESVNDTAGTSALALDTAELALDTAQDALALVGERTQYVVLGPYGPGLHFQTTSQVFSYDAGSGAEFYAPGPAITLPYTTTGVGAAEIANFRSVGDAVLRQDLADDVNPAKNSGMVAHNPALAYADGTAGGALNAIVRVMAVGVLQEGAVADGVTDDSAAFIAARAKAALTGKFVYAPAGTYKLNAAVIGSEDLRLIGDGDSTILDFTGTVTGGNYALEATGTATQIEELSGTQTVGSNTVLFVSPPSLVPGDVFVIYNRTDASWSGFRPEYHAGEWCQVESISGSTVTTVSPLYDTYAAAAVDVYKITGPKVCLHDFKIIGTTIPGLIRTTFCLEPVMENITGEHANDSVLYLDRCWKPTINNPNVRNVGDGGSDYGISVGNSQHARIKGGSSYSRRHAVTHGGTSAICNVPVRDSRVRGMLIRNDTSSGTEAADFHGNTEDSSFENCTIYGGANLQGKDNFYANCVITAVLTGHCVQHAEVKGGRLGIRGCGLRSYVDPQASLRGIYDIGGNSNAITASTVLPCTFFIEGCTVFGRNMTSSSYFARFRNAGSTQTMNIEIDGVSGDVNLMSAILLTGLTTGTAASNRIIVDNVKGFPAGTLLHNAAGSAYLNFPHRMQRQTGRQTLTATSGTAVTLGTAETFRYAYPREPSGFATPVGGAVGNRTPIAALNILTATTIRPIIFTGDQVNWTSTADRVVSWSAEISEV